MAVLIMSPLALLTIYVCAGTQISGSEPHNFPLGGCFTDKMDILFLYYNFKSDIYQFSQQSFISDFASAITHHDDIQDEAMLRVKFSVINGTSSVSSKVNVSSWNFTSFSKSTPYNFDDKIEKIRQYNNVNEIVRPKIQFVQRLFSQMGGVRKNATHVSVIFLYGAGLSFEESRRIADVAQQEQQQVTDIKTLFVVLGVRHVHDIVYMRDTLLVGYESIWLSQHILMMTICNKCSDGWFPLKRNDHIDYFSCYLFVVSEASVNWDDAMEECSNQDSSLVTIETKEELKFLQSKIPTYLKDSASLRFNVNSSNGPTDLYIGLRRVSRNVARRFHWFQQRWSIQIRPLVVNHWLPGKPSGAFNSECGVWRFDCNGSCVDAGWVDVVCGDTVSSLSLCETIVPLRVEDMNVMVMKPTTNESLSQVLTEGDFIIYRGNVVSVSANIGETDFQKFFKTSKQGLFPLFDCGLGVPAPRYISYIYVCDSVNHCSNRRDEMFCVVRSQETKMNKQELLKECSGVYCCDSFCLQIQWVNDGQVDCNVCGHSGGSEVNDESEVLNKYLKRNETCAFICNADQCVDFSQLNDGRQDCTGAEGPIDETIGKLEQAGTCYNILGHIIWAPKCVYIRDRYGAVLGCRDMSHLDNCTDFECPDQYVKCPNTYCIPQHYVLDRTLDCPSGEDENNYTIASCTGNFACWNSKICLHPDLVCDGHPDCPNKDDEVDCSATCFEGLRCISGTVTVTDYKILEFSTLDGGIDSRNRYLDLYGVDLSSSDFVFLENLENLITISVSNCNMILTNFDFDKYPNGLQELDLSYNKLQICDGSERYQPLPKRLRYWNLSHNTDLVEVSNFQLNFLETLDLSHTSLSILGQYFFEWFPSLKNLDLSFTKIKRICDVTFSHNLILQTLDLRGLSLDDFHEDVFNGLTVNQDLYTDSFQLCCPQIRGSNISPSTCHAPNNAISSCFDLIGVNVQRVLLWVVAVLAVLGNVTVIVYRVIWDRSVLKTGYGLFVTNLGISDFIMGVYLFIIAGADYYYRDVYVLYDKSWRESVVCKLAGFLATLSSETSTFFVFLITLDRFLMMKFPFGHESISKMIKIFALPLSWIIGFLLALTPIVFRFEINSSNAMCLGLPLTTKRLNGWEFSFAVFIVLNFCLVLLIVFGQRAIFRAMSENRRTQTASRRLEDITVAKQLSLVALSNFLCWFPIGVMGLLSVSGHVISNDVYAWTSITVLPINSAANPLLYTISSLMAKWKRFKGVEKRAIETYT